MNKKLIKTIVSIVSGVGLAGGIPIITNSCATNTSLPRDAFDIDEQTHTLRGFSEEFKKNPEKYSGCKTICIFKDIEVIDTQAFDKGFDGIHINKVFCESNSKLKTIGVEAFASSESLVEIELPDSLQAIYDRAFSGCTNLETIDFKNVSTIGSEVFKNCESLKKVVFSNNLKVISKHCFEGCSSLKEVTIPEGVITIQSAAFLHCSSLESISLPNSLQILPNPASEPASKADLRVFGGCPLKKIVLGAHNEKFKLINLGTLNSRGLVGIDDSDTLDGSTRIYGACACGVLQYHSDVQEIEPYSFSGCAGITSIRLPEGLTTIKEGAFYGCSGINEITFPSSVKTIGSFAFKKCSNLQKFNLTTGMQDASASIGNGVFENCRINDILLPEGGFTIDTKTYHKVPIGRQGIAILSTTTFNNTSEVLWGLAFGDVAITEDNFFSDSDQGIIKVKFVNCYSITKLFFGNVVKGFGDDVFGSCRGIDQITWDGLAEVPSPAGTASSAFNFIRNSGYILCTNPASRNINSTILWSHYFVQMFHYGDDDSIRPFQNWTPIEVNN